METQVSNYSDVDLVRALRQSASALEFKILSLNKQNECISENLYEDIKEARKSLEVIKASIAHFVEKGFV